MALAAVVVVAVRSAGSDCALPAPTVDVPAQLQATGAVAGTPLDSGDTQGLRELSVQVAQAVGGTTFVSADAEQPVAERALDTTRHDATVVPVTVLKSDNPRRLLGGLVVFLDDCQGRHYLSGFRDVSAADHVWTGSLGSGLVYRTDPADPAQRRADGSLAPAI